MNDFPFFLGLCWIVLHESTKHVIDASSVYYHYTIQGGANGVEAVVFLYFCTEYGLTATCRITFSNIEKSASFVAYCENKFKNVVSGTTHSFLIGIERISNSPFMVSPHAEKIDFDYTFPSNVKFEISQVSL